MTAELRFPGRPVERHAGHVAEVADALETARSVVREVTMERDAYGILCQFLPGILGPVFEAGVDALNSSVDALHETAARLRSTADGLTGADEASRYRIESSR